MDYINRTLYAGLAAFGLSAQASNVTVYGNLDIGLVAERGSAARIGKGFNNWLGVKGQEAIDADVDATFQLEARFEPDTGMPETRVLFQGESTVGLSSKALGTLRVGRALTPLWAEKWAYDPWYDSWLMGSQGMHNGDFDSDGLPSDDYHDYSRVGHAVFYRTPVYAGLSAQAAVEMGKPAGAAARSVGASVNYAGGALSAMVAYERNHVADHILYFGGACSIGGLTLIGSYSHARTESLMLAFTYSAGGGTIRSGYGHTRHGGHKASIGYIHALSKRTNAYADLYRDGVALGMNHSF